MKRTATLPQAPAIAEGPPPRAIGQFPPASGELSTLNVRVPGGLICAAGVLVLVSIFLPWSSVGSGAKGHVGAEFRSGALVAIEAVALFLAGLRLWRTRRRWVASLLAGGASLFGIAGVALPATSWCDSATPDTPRDCWCCSVRISSRRSPGTAPRDGL